MSRPRDDEPGPKMAQMWLCLVFIFGFCMRAMQGTSSKPTPAPTVAAAQVSLSLTLTFSGLSWAAVTSDDPAGSITSAVQTSVTSALGITTQVKAGSATVGVPRWALAASTLHGRRLSAMQASMGVIANTADLAAGSSAAQVQASLILSGDDIAKAVQLASGLSSVGFFGATASLSVAPAPSRWPRPTPGPISKPAYSDGAVSNIGLVVGIILGCGLLGGGFVVCCVYARYVYLRRLLSAAASADGPENAYDELTGDAWAEAEGGSGGEDECGFAVQATAELVAASNGDSALPVAMALSVLSNDSVAVAFQEDAEASVVGRAEPVARA